MISFIVCLGFWILLILYDLFSYFSIHDMGVWCVRTAVNFLSEVFLGLSLIGIWLNFPRKISLMFIICFCISRLVNDIWSTSEMIYFTIDTEDIKYFVRMYGIFVFRFISLFLIYKGNRKIEFFICYLIGVVILFIRTILYGTYSIFFLISCICFALLWLPNIIYNTCPTCGFKNKKKVKFCGGCGNKIELIKLAKR